jgi:hypothetical protein
MDGVLAPSRERGGLSEPWRACVTDDQLPAYIAQARHLRRIAEDLYRRIEETKMRTRVLLRDTQRIRRDLEEVGAPAPREPLLQRDPYARLLARLETMPVIEQAKGIIMAQSHCGETEAFDLLRRASQRSNVPVREIAALITAKSSSASADRPAEAAGLPPEPGFRHRVTSMVDTELKALAQARPVPGRFAVAVPSRTARAGPPRRSS